MVDVAPKAPCATVEEPELEDDVELAAIREGPAAVAVAAEKAGKLELDTLVLGAGCAACGGAGDEGNSTSGC